MVSIEEEENNNNNSFSDESQTTDYTSIEGIRTKTGIDDDRTFGKFIYKELIDNALDFIESNTRDFVNSGQSPFVNIEISEEENEIIKIKIKNSSNSNKQFFTKERLDKIFDFQRYFSSKRHQYIIKRGALGDGLKEVLIIPYAFAIENNNESWNYPLIINVSDEKIFKIGITNLSEIKRSGEIPKPDVKEIKFIKEENNNENFTEITVYIPKKFSDYNEINQLLINYSLFNTHITFKNHCCLKSRSTFLKIYNATQKIDNWSNYQSIYYYSLPEFERLIYSFEHKSNSDIANYVQKNFREGTNIKIVELLEILNSSSDDKKLENIYQRLRKIPPPKNKNEHLKFPFDSRKREQAIKDRVKKIFGIDEEDIEYKKIPGYYPSDENGVEFPFILEIVVADSPLNDKTLHLNSNINYSHSLTYNPFYNKSREKIFTWKNKNTNNIKEEDSLIDILEDCGFSHDSKKHKRGNGNLVFINLISPKIGYRNQSKTSIHLKPFASSAQEIFNFFKVISYKNKTGLKKGDIIDELRDLIEDRVQEVKDNPRIKKIGRWTQSTVFYYLRPILLDKGAILGKNTRKYITSKINQVCKEFGFKRHELGIIAAERAQLYFKGESHGVGFTQLEELAKKGTDLLIIEKEGVADVLAPFADEKGIAILNTRGFLTEYAEDLSELAEVEECNIAILTDFDSSGLLISTVLPDVHRIGIDFKTLEKLRLDEKTVEEENKSDDHLTSLKKMDYQIPSPYSETEWNNMIDYLDSGKRIEIDSVLRVRGNERFWNYIKEELDSVFPNRDYNRAIDIPEYVPPKEIDDLFANIKNIVSDFQADERENISNELKDIKGFINVKPKEEEIKDRLGSNIQDNLDVKNKILDVIKNFSFNN